MDVIFRAMGCISPSFPMLSRLGPITFSTGFLLPNLSQILPIFVDLHLFLPKFYQFWHLIFNPIFAVCMLWATSLTPEFALSYPKGDL